MMSACQRSEYKDLICPWCLPVVPLLSPSVCLIKRTAGSPGSHQESLPPPPSSHILPLSILGPEQSLLTPLIIIKQNEILSSILFCFLPQCTENFRNEGTLGFVGLNFHSHSIFLPPPLTRTAETFCDFESELDVIESWPPNICLGTQQRGCWGPVNLFFFLHSE